MGCNCGGGVSGRVYYANSGGSSWAAAANTQGQLVYIVDIPNEGTREFTSETEAYRAIAKTGGGIRSEWRPNS